MTAHRAPIWLRALIIIGVLFLAVKILRNVTESLTVIAGGG